MKLLSRIVQFFATPIPEPLKEGAAYNSPFESANHTPNRARTPGGAPKDFKLELTEGVRSDILEKTRYADKNSGVIREIVRSNVLYAVGHGLRVQSGAEPGWKTQAMRYWKRATRRVDITGRFSLADVQRLVSRALDVDGEIFVLKVRHPETGAALLQLVRGHRVGDFGKGGTTDGIKYDGIGAPVEYRILQDDGNTKEFPAWQVLHIFDPESPDFVRATSPLQHGANHTMDGIELLALEKLAVRANVEVARTITTETGDLGEEGDYKVQEVVSASGDRSDPVAIQKIMGGRIAALKPGEEMESYQSSRPSPTFTGFLEHLDRDTALGNLPYEFAVNPSGINGGAVRLVTTKADRIFSMRQDIIFERLIIAAWFWIIGDAIDSGALPVALDWWEIDFVAPRKLTADAARESASNRADVEMGLKTFSDHFEEGGADFEEEMERRAQEVVFLQALAEKYKIPVEMLFRPTRPATPAAVTPPSAKLAK
ncbi:phage portal protein [Verrucomicrobium sp. BvORR106]|uniref:phage portal protein n=1 Tax=Verrucomicrobium sp. BvORR106 TaxID=1403819 RepID=UPI00056DBF43|nr:phage portal protein [Verrucomicrobium sp. BvORR106]